MSNVVELSRYRVQQPDDDAVDRAVTEEIEHGARTDPWMSDFVARIEKDAAAEDMLYVCLNRPLAESMLERAEEIEAVLPKPPPCGLVNSPGGLMRADITTRALSAIVDELRHSTHVLWLSMPDHYAAIAAEYRRRLDRYNRLCTLIDTQH